MFVGRIVLKKYDGIIGSATALYLILPGYYLLMKNLLMKKIPEGMNHGKITEQPTLLAILRQLGHLLLAVVQLGRKIL